MKICITGKPGSGKSLAIEYIKSAGYNTWVADEYVHEIYKVNKEGYKAIKKAFGPKFVNKKEVDRKALGQLVFTDKKALVKLNNLINPLIVKAIKKLDKKQDWFIELATYIFYPQTFANIFDKIVLIFSNSDWKKKVQNKKFSYLKKIPTMFVENSKNDSNPILYIGKEYCKSAPINVDIYVNNCQSKKYFQTNILKVCKKLI